VHDGRIMEPSDALHSFRHSLYECLHRRGDALFELADAILTAEAIHSPVHLSLQASHRRGWGSLYAALDRGRIDVEAPQRLLARHPLAGSETPVRLTGQPVFLGTGSVESEGADIELTAAKTPGMPAVAGRVRMSGNTLEITGISERRAAVPGRIPESVEPPMQ